MMRRVLACLIVGLAACGTTPRDPLSPVPGRAMATVTDVLAKGRFDPAETGWVRDGVAYRSEVSGLYCAGEITLDDSGDFPAATLNTITSYRPDGTDASCNYVAPAAGTVLTVYATEAAGFTGAEYFRDARLAIAERFAAPQEISLAAPVLPDAEVHAAAFAVPRGDGNPYDRVTSVWTASQNGWHVKVRATYPASLAAGEAAGASLLAASAPGVLNTD